MMTGAELKGMGRDRWGINSGGLTARECDILMDVVREHAEGRGSAEVLELGHYCGLSTACLVEGLKASGADWSLRTVDHYIGDACMPASTMVEAKGKMTQNAADLWAGLPVDVVDGRMQDNYPAGESFIFYDADHGAAQLEYIQKAAATDCVKLIGMDDAGLLPGVTKTCAYLRGIGWTSTGPPLKPNKGKSGGNSLAFYQRPA